MRAFQLMLVVLVAVLAQLFAETQPGGLYQVNGRLVDAEGNPAKRSRKAAAETDDDEAEEAALAEAARKQAEEAAKINQKGK